MPKSVSPLMKRLSPAWLRRWIFIFLLLAAAPLRFAAAQELIDRIVAIVEDGVILESELNQQVSAIVSRLQKSDTPLPPAFVLRRQMLERMILDKLQRQLGEKSGITVSDDMLRQSIAELASRNDMSVEQFRGALQEQGIEYKDFVDNIRNEIIISQLRAREISSRIKVTDPEVEHYLETQGKAGSDTTQYHIGHILIATPEAASPLQVQKAHEKAERIVEELLSGHDFKQTAISVSDGAQALNGGDLGWRALSQLPTLFVDAVSKMKAGDIEGPIRSPSGFHIIKMLELRGADSHVITQTHARHLLVKLNELINDEEAQKRLLALKKRIKDGEDFDVLARTHSDDPATAIKGGDLGWVSPGALVPPFEEAMNRLGVNEISEPVQTQFGWHLIQVLERQQRDDSEQYKKNLVREEIRKRKIEEETELWLRRLRDEAYVETRLDGD